MKIKFLFSAAAMLALVFTSCSNDDDAVVIPTPAPAATGFTWKENDPDGADNSAATATFSTQYKTLIAKDASDATLFEINLDGTSAATYTIGATNHVTYVAQNPYFAAETGDVTITSNASGKVSGTFTALRTGSGLTRIYGKFTDITVVP